ncbi:hypothetical protein CN372_05050 [Bacillus anthracis]|nr:hypothetical protein CN372_05050 [Bacillus anthracis]
MQPILFASDERNFNTLGLGVIANVSKCEVVEELNGMYELEMVIYNEDGFGGDLINATPMPLERDIILAKANDFDRGQPFRIYKITKLDDFSIEIYAKHVTFDANKYYVSSIAKHESSFNAALQEVTGNIEPKNHPFRLSTDLETVTQFESMFKGLGDLIQGTEGSLLQRYGGEISRDMYHIRYNRRRGQDTDIVIAAEKNMTGLEVDIDIDGVITRIVPWANKNENAESGGKGAEEYIYLPERFIDSPHINNYEQPLIESVEFNDVDTVEQLRSKAKGFFTRNKRDIPKVNVKVQFIPLWEIHGYEDFVNIERLQMGDRVKVSHPRITADMSARVVKTIYDPIEEHYIEIELGDFATTISSETHKNSIDVIERSEKDRTSWEKVVDIVTEKITGNDGGHVVLHPKLNPQEIFIMDTDNLNTAKQVLRMNKEGIGFSKTGINGRFETAWTVDGIFIADFIKSGTLDTSLLKTGVIKGSNGNMVIDLSNDMLDIRNGAISITRPDGYKVINNGMANFDLTVSEATPQWRDLGVIADGSWMTTLHSSMKDVQLFSLRHQSRYFRLHLGVAVEGGGRGKIEVVDMMGRVMAKREFTNDLEHHDAQSGITLTIDLGKPDGDLKSYLLKVARTSGSGENRALVRKIICWIDG